MTKSRFKLLPKNSKSVQRTSKDGFKTAMREKKVNSLELGCGRKTKDIQMQKSLIQWIN